MTKTDLKLVYVKGWDKGFLENPETVWEFYTVPLLTKHTTLSGKGLHPNQIIIPDSPLGYFFSIEKSKKILEEEVLFPGNALYFLGIIEDPGICGFLATDCNGKRPATKEDFSKELINKSSLDLTKLVEYNLRIAGSMMLGYTITKQEQKKVKDALKKHWKKLTKDYRDGKSLIGLRYHPEKRDKDLCTIDCYQIIAKGYRKKVPNPRDLIGFEHQIPSCGNEYEFVFPKEKTSIKEIKLDEIMGKLQDRTFEVVKSISEYIEK